MDDLLEIIDYVKNAGARFADVREQSVRNRYVVTKDTRAEHLVDETNTGTGIRVLYGNGWGYAATKDKTPEGLRKAADKALELAKLASPLANEPIILASEPKHIAKFSTKAVKDVETVPLEEPLERMIAAGEKILKQKDMYLDIDPDYAKAKKYYLLAEAEGSHHSVAMLGEMHRFGRGFIEDKKETKKLFEKAIRMGDERAKRETVYID